MVRCSNQLLAFIEWHVRAQNIPLPENGGDGEEAGKWGGNGEKMGRNEKENGGNGIILALVAVAPQSGNTATVAEELAEAL